MKLKPLTTDIVYTYCLWYIDVCLWNFKVGGRISIVSTTKITP